MASAADTVRLNTHDPAIADMIANVVEAGSSILVCRPCTQVRGYDKSCFIDGAGLAGSAAMLRVVSEGASTLTF